jgi:hypothetical protein
MIEFVGNYSILLAQERLKQSTVRVKARRVKDRIFGVKKLREFGFQLFVDALRPADEPDTCQAIAPHVQGIFSRGVNGGKLGQAEVIIRA